MIAFTDLDFSGQFEQKPWDDLPEKFDLMEITNGNLEFEDLFGDDPEYYYFQNGDLFIPGHTCVDRPDDEMMVVIDGNLTVDGVLCLSAWDMACIVVVTGNFSAKGLIIDSEAHFHVLGETAIDGPLVGNLGDSAYCRFVGKCRAQALVPGENGEMEFVWNDESDEDVSDDTGDEVDAEKYPDIAATVNKLRYATGGPEPRLSLLELVRPAIALVVCESYGMHPVHQHR